MAKTKESNDETVVEHKLLEAELAIAKRIVEKESQPLK